jgi:MarR family transcriptional regulator, transcriptional regulator for hemolysin
MTITTQTRTAPDLSFLLTHTSRVLSTQMTAALAEIGLTPRGYCVLEHASGGELTQIELARLGDMDKTTMVVTMDELEAAGLAERKPAPSDRRARIVVVTPEGRRVAAAGQQIVDRVHGDVLRALPEAEREVLVGALTRLAEGHLSTPVDCDQPVRRRREARG